MKRIVAMSKMSEAVTEAMGLGAVALVEMPAAVPISPHHGASRRGGSGKAALDMRGHRLGSVYGAPTYLYSRSRNSNRVRLRPGRDSLTHAPDAFDMTLCETARC